MKNKREVSLPINFMTESTPTNNLSKDTIEKSFFQKNTSQLDINMGDLEND